MEMSCLEIFASLSWFQANCPNTAVRCIEAAIVFRFTLFDHVRQPKDCRAPTQGLSGSFFFFLKKKKRFDYLSELLVADVSEDTWWVVLGSLAFFIYSWLSSLLPRSLCSVSSIPGLCRHF